MHIFTVRYMHAGEMEIDFVDHGDASPAFACAHLAQVGALCGFAGIRLLKVAEFYTDTYLLAADLSQLPVAAANL